MTYAFTIAGPTATKCGSVDLTVTVNADGPSDGSAAVIRELREAFGKVPRLAGCDVSPVAALHDDGYYTDAEVHRE